jgi:hypothetical protein
MSTDLDIKLIQVTAGADLDGDASKFKAVTLAGTIAATPLLAAGILRHGAKNGEQLSVAYQGVFKALFGAAVGTVGYPLTVTTSGFIVAASSGGATIGRSRAVVASGDLATAFFDFTQLGYSTVA